MYVFVMREGSCTLTEMTPARLKAACAARGEARYPDYRRASGAEAHRYVKDGGHHETRLWVKDGRVRRG